MRKTSGRKILGVFIFCFVSISVFGISGNAWRNDLPLLLLNFDKLSYQSSIDISTFRQAQGSAGSMQRGFDQLSYRSSNINTSCLFKQGNGLYPEVIVQDRISQKTFFLSFSQTGKVQTPSPIFTSLIGLPFNWLALGYFMLVLNTSITQSV